MKQLQFLYEIFSQSTGVSTDSRTVERGELFFALKGDNFDGNRYAQQAIELGASYAIVDDPSYAKGSNILLVEDTLSALQELAKYHRAQFDIPVIAITGSNGKTTTKELVSRVLAVKYNLLSTVGNLNNHIGVPLTLLKLNSSTQAAVIEMGASALGEIALLSKIAQPTIGIITNIGKAHLLGFGSQQGVIKAKGELYDYLEEHGGRALYNADDELLRKMVMERPTLASLPYGKSLSNAELISNEGKEPFLSVCLGNGEKVRTNLIGNYNLNNLLAALAAGALLGCNRGLAIDAIESYLPTNNRSQFIKGANNTLIVDAYNANPTSMRVALENFGTIESSHKMAILGDMLELGKESLAEHQAILTLAASMELEQLLLVGDEFAKAIKELKEHFTAEQERKLLHFSTTSQLCLHLTQTKPFGATILIKGSRGIKLETTIPILS